MDRQILFGIGIAIVLVVFSYWWRWSKLTTTVDPLSKYTFSQGQNNIAPHDLNTNRLQKTASPVEMATHCDETPTFLGFNYLGFMMDNRAHHTVASWQEIPDAGLYLRRISES